MCGGRGKCAVGSARRGPLEMDGAIVSSTASVSAPEVHSEPQAAEVTSRASLIVSVEFLCLTSSAPPPSLRAGSPNPSIRNPASNPPVRSTRLATRATQRGRQLPRLDDAAVHSALTSARRALKSPLYPCVTSKGE